MEDEPDFADLAATYLERADERLDIETATSAEEALDRLDDAEYDCVVSDFEMPRTDGIDFLERVRERSPDLPFILFTGKGSEEIASEAISAGVTDYLQKSRDTSQYELLANRIGNAVEQYRAERRARLQERQYRDLFEDAPIMYVLVRDARGWPVIEDCNDRFIEKLGYDRAEVIGRPTTDLFSDESTKSVYEGGGYERALAGDFGREERTLVAADGDRIDTVLRASPRLDENGDVIGAQTLYLDITDRKDRERELERYETIVEVSGDAVYTLDAEGHLTFVNDAFCELVGYTEAELLGEYVSLVMDDEDIARSEAIIRELLATETDHATVEMELVRADGERITCETHIALLPLDEDGEFRGTTGTHRDITGRIQRERELEWYETMVETVPDGLYAMDEDLQFLAVNRGLADMVDYSREELLGSHLSMVNHEGGVRAAKRNREQLVDEDGTVDDAIRVLEHVLVTDDGEEIPCEARFRALPPAEDGSFRGTAGVVRDISERLETETRLRAERDRLSALFDDAPQPMIEGELRGNDRYPIVGVNDAFESTFGFDADEIVGRDIADALVPADERAEHESFRERVGHGESFSAEVERTTLDGQRTFLIDVVAYGTDSTPADGWFATYTDITERNERERELELYETMLETVPDGVYALDEEFEYVAVNQGMVDLVGYSKDELIGRSASLVVDDEELKQAQRQREQLKAGGVDDTVMRAEHHLRPADGGTVPTEARYRALPPAEGGSFRGTAGVLRDISERKRRERELKRYEQIVNTMDEAACIYDEDGRFVVANEYLAEFYGTTPAALEGEQSNLIPRIRAEHGADVYEHLLNGTRDEIHGEIEGEFPGHGDVVVAYRLTPLLVDGAVDGVVGVAREVTEQRRRERELERQNERLEEFASVVSHDLRNPLNVAEGHVELAREECDSTHLDTAARALDRMDMLIEDILTVAREGTEVESTEPTDLAAVVEACWGNVDTAAGTLAVDTDATIDADRSRLQQLLENLVRNAVEHGGADVTITVGNLDSDDGRGFYLEDDGPGIPVDERERIFESGYSTIEEGTGFGLAIAKEIVEAHGWRIDATASESGGARFEITGVDSGTVSDA